MRNVIGFVIDGALMLVDKAIESRALSWLSAACLASVGVAAALGTMHVGDNLAVRVVFAWLVLTAAQRAAVHAATGKVRAWVSR